MTSPLVVAGSDPRTGRVADRLQLPLADGPVDVAAVVVVTGAADLEAVRDAVALDRGRVAAVVALELAEDLVVALYDLGLPVAFGFCTRAELDLAIAAAPDGDGRHLAAALAAVEHAVVAGPQQRRDVR